MRLIIRMMIKNLDYNSTIALNYFYLNTISYVFEGITLL
jgi:hypothetical protein